MLHLKMLLKSEASISAMRRTNNHKSLLFFKYQLISIIPKSTWMIECNFSRTVSRGRAFAVLGRIIGSIIRLDTNTVSGIVSILGFFALLAASPCPPVFEGRKKGLGPLGHRRYVPMVVMVLLDMRVSVLRGLGRRRPARRQLFIINS